MRISDWSSDVCSSDLIDAEQRGMGMDRRGIQALQIEERDRRVDQEAENTGAQHVPEGHRDEAHQRPFHRTHPWRALAIAPMLPQIGSASCGERVCRYV